MSRAKGLGFEVALNYVRTIEGAEEAPPFAFHLQRAQRKALKDRMKDQPDPVWARFMAAFDLGIIRHFEVGLKLGIMQRCTKPTDDAMDLSVYDLIVEAKRKIIYDFQLFLFVWSTISRADAFWYDHNGLKDFAEECDSIRRWFLANYGEYGMLLPLADAQRRLTSEYKREMSMVTMRKPMEETLFALCRDSDFRSPVSPTYLVGYCGSYTAGRGCHHDKGRPNCLLRHSCWQCDLKRRSSANTHGFADCRYHKSYFKEGQMGSHETKFIRKSKKSKATRPNIKTADLKSRKKKQRAQQRDAE